jgi:hypothetical protein
MKSKNRVLIDSLVSEINNTLGYNYIEANGRNGYIYIDEIATGNSILNSATSSKEVIIALRSFKSGIYTEKRNLLIEPSERVFMIVTSTGKQFFCYLRQLNSICSDLNQGYYTIYHFWNNKQQKVTKKHLRELFEAHRIEQKFFY